VTFPAAEYRARVARAQAMMSEAGLDALLLTTEPEIRYVTGFLTRFWESPTRPWYVVLPAQGDPVAVIPSIGADVMARTWITDIRTWRSPDPEDDGVSLLADALRAAGPRVGIPKGPETHLRMPQAALERIGQAVTLRDSRDIIRRLRSIKSGAEIARIAEACAIAGRAFARVPEIAAEGTALSEVFRRFQMLCLDEGADWVPYLAGGAGPDGYGDVISPATDRSLARGDVLMLDTGLVKQGYFCDFDRNWSVGPPSPAAAAGHARLADAVDAALSLCRAGNSAADLFHAMDRIVTGGAGGSDAGRLGHGLGMELTEGLSLIPGDRTELRPGMVITLEPGIRIAPGRMIVHEEVVAITDGAPRLLSPRAPRDLPVI
jgi:Xaa-Pro aminopeptidase